MAVPLARLKQPNFLVVMLDDLTPFHYRQFHAVTPYSGDNPKNTFWDPTGANLYVHAPWLDSIAQRGVTFLNAYANPVCGADRASVFTGQYTFRHGIGHLPTLGEVPASLNDTLAYEHTLLPEVMQGLGYRCGAVGKYHLVSYDPLLTVEEQLDHTHQVAGFDWFAVTYYNLAAPAPKPPGPMGENWGGDNYNFYTYKGTPGSATLRTTQSPGDGFADHLAEDWSVTVQVDDAIEFITGEGDDPWVCYLALNIPHDPPDKPANTSLINTAVFDVTDPPQGTNFTNYQAILEATDNELQRLQDAMDPGVWARTVVLFTADNGGLEDVLVNARDGFGVDLGAEMDALLDDQENRLKNSPFELGLRVPLVIAGPGVRGGRTTRALFQSVDLFPTIVGLAGGTVSGIDGRNQTAVLRNTSNGIRMHTLCMRFAPNGDESVASNSRDIGHSKILSGVATPGRYKLAVRLGETDRLYLLEDLDGNPVDPLEQNDLWNDPGYTAEQAAMVASLAGLLAS